MNPYMMSAFNDEMNKIAKSNSISSPELVDIPNMSPEAVRQAYDDLEAMHHSRLAKLKTLRPGSLRYRYNQRMARLHRQDADSFLASTYK